MTTGTTRLARVLVHLYPRAWRARYEDEMVALIGEQPATAPVLLDIAAGASASGLEPWRGDGAHRSR